MSKTSRRKGRAGESKAKQLLLDRDWEVADLTAGVESEDFWATDKDGVTWSVEVKNRKLIAIDTFRQQAMRNSKSKKWMLLIHIYGTSEWLVMRQGQRSVIWREKK